jgi:hypothetical protein
LRTCKNGHRYFRSSNRPTCPTCEEADGAVSNARTYTLKDLDTLFKVSETEDYNWEKGKITGRAKKIYLLGTPVKN